MSDRTLLQAILADAEEALEIIGPFRGRDPLRDRIANIADNVRHALAETDENGSLEEGS